MVVGELADLLLEFEQAIVQGVVQLPVGEDARVELLLGLGAGVLVLGEDALVGGVDSLELLVGGVLLAEDFYDDL